MTRGPRGSPGARQSPSARWQVQGGAGRSRQLLAALGAVAASMAVSSSAGTGDRSWLRGEQRERFVPNALLLSAFGVHLALASCIAFQLRVLGWDGDAVAILTRTCDNLRRTLSQRLQTPGLETAQARGAIQREMRSRSHRDICGHDPKRRPPTQDERQERTLRMQSVRSSEAARAKRFIAHRSAQESGLNRVFEP